MYKIKDSGKRIKYASGFNRDVNDNKPRYDLIPYEPLKRLAMHYTNGAIKYGDCNWKLAKTDVEINRFKESAWRHFTQWANGEDDEDHMSATIFNLWGYDWCLKNNKNKK